MARAVPLPPDRVAFEPDRQAAVRRVTDRATAGDVVLTVGAGDVTALGPVLLGSLRDRAGEREPVGESRG